MVLTFIKDAAAFAQNIVKNGICGRGKRTNDPVTPAVFDIKVVCMEMAAAIGVTVGFAFLRSAVRRVARRFARKKVRTIRRNRPDAADPQKLG
jgi:hypothetical protein